MKRYFGWKFLTIIIFTLVLGFFDLPSATQTKILPFAPEFFTKAKITLGLDLQGGAQLDYKMDLRQVPEKDRESIIDGVQQVIEKRVNRLGVSEPNIFRSQIAEEAHIIVELAETADTNQEDVDNYLGYEKALADLTEDEKKTVILNKAKAIVGKTIQLEFKEERTDIDPEEEKKVRAQAEAALERINDGEDFAIVGQEEAQANPGKVLYIQPEYTFESNLSGDLKTTLTSLKPGESHDTLIESVGNYTIDPDSGEIVEDKGVLILKLMETRDEVKTPKEIDASHILIAYSGAKEAAETVTRNKTEAKKLAKDIAGRLENGGNFADLAKEFSDDASNKDSGGTLTSPVNGGGGYVPDFEQATLALKKEGEISDVTETEFGFHLIRADKIRRDLTEKQYKYETINFSTRPDPWQETGLTGKHFVHADVQLDNAFQSYVSIQFNEEGAKLFADVTANNVGKRLAIFVGGEYISAPRVNEKIEGGQAQITGQFTNDEAQKLARDLNTGAIPAPIVLTGEYTIGATLGQEALDKSLKAGLIGFIIVCLFMLLYYRLPGLIASLALLIYGIILLFLIKANLHIGIAILLALAVFAMLVVKIVNNHDSGWEKFLSFILACFGFFFITFLLKTGVVITLAGIAGIILSVGMAVDANILIFERMKEELREGHKLETAIETGFTKAWSAIRDSNFSTLLTCAILFYFGSSIIRGFAFNLAAGILVSMFTAMTITKTLLTGFVGRKIAENKKVFGLISDHVRAPIKFIQKSKVWFLLSGTIVTASILAMAIFGLNLGLDFKGGTLLEFKFSEAVSSETLTGAFKEIEEEINTDNTDTADTVTESGGITLSEDQSATVDLTKIQITPSDKNSYIVKTKYLTSEQHESIIEKMQEKLPDFTEPRFTTIGPTIGKTLLHKAIIAIIFAVIMMIIYIALAFRKIPKEVSPWRFGVSAIVALIHDVLIVTGVFVILGQFLNVEIDTLFITAMLTVFGYSVNDTIVVMDRLRENLIHHDERSLLENANISLTETMARSINTSLSTVLAILPILFFGSPAIFYFVLALTIGIVIGTYSSIFVAAPLLLVMNKRKVD